MGPLLQVFNRYRERGGEEKSVARILGHVAQICPIEKCWFDSREWDAPGAPGPLRQAVLVGNNPSSRRRLREATTACGAKAWLVHNVIPVASLGVYREAAELGVPILQYCHNFRPFSVSGTLWADGRTCDAGLRGQFGPEVRAGAWQESRLKSAILAWHLRRLHRSGVLEVVEQWIAISQFVADRFVEAGVPRDRVTTLRHSWDARESAPAWQDDGYYLFLGRLVEEKGVRTLLDAWELLERELRERCPRLVIGGTGPLAEAVTAAAQCSRAVEYRGFVEGEEKQALIDRCRAMVGPSVWWEPLGLVTYEAYDAGKPMLAAASGGLTETVREEVTGFLHVPGDAPSLAESVRRLEDRSESERRAMGAAGKDWLRSEASPERWRTQFAEILEKCAA